MHVNSFCDVRVEFFHALRADAVAEISFRMIPYVDLHVLPVALVISYFLAVGAYGKQSSQSLNLSKGFFELVDFRFKQFFLCGRENRSFH